MQDLGDSMRIGSCCGARDPARRGDGFGLGRSTPDGHRQVDRSLPASISMAAAPTRAAPAPAHDDFQPQTGPGATAREAPQGQAGCADVQCRETILGS